MSTPPVVGVWGERRGPSPPPPPASPETRRGVKCHLARAEADDAPFLARACLRAERAHVGYGIWDLVFGDRVRGGGAGRPATEVAERRRKAADAAESTALAVLEDAIRSDEASPFHFSRFIVARDTTVEGAPAVAAACGFHYPHQQLTTALPGLQAAAARRARSRGGSGGAGGPKGGGGWDEAAFKERTARLRAVAAGFPANDAVERLYGGQAWMVEAVYVAPTHRRRGLGERVTLAAAAAGNGTGLRTCGINVATGNDGARRVYERMGFRLIGTGDSDDCEEAIGVRGFHILTASLGELTERSELHGDALPHGCSGRAACRCSKCKAALAELHDDDAAESESKYEASPAYISPEERERARRARK